MKPRRPLTLRDLNGAQAERVAEITLDVMTRLIGLRSRAAIDAMRRINPIIRRELKRASRAAAGGGR